MRVNRSLLGWGLFFIVLGSVVLAVRQGVLPADQAGRAWMLWPLLLILGGVGLLLRRTPIEPITGLASAALFGLIAGGLIGSGGIPAGSCGDDEGAVPFAARSGELGATAEVDMTLLCGELGLRTAEGSAWRIEGADEDGDGPDVESAPDRLEVSDARVASFAGTHARWTVTLPTATRLAVEATVNAGTATFDLDGARLDRLEATVNAGEATFDLGGVVEIGGLEVQANAGSIRVVLPATSLAGSIQANAGSVRLCAPPGVGLRARFNGVLASHDFGESGLVERGDVWEIGGLRVRRREARPGDPGQRRQRRARTGGKLRCVIGSTGPAGTG